MSGRIVIAGLQKSFGEVTALRGLDLEVAEGEMVGLIGPDGAGKTTLMRLLCGLMVADGGQATVAGFDIGKQSGEIKKIAGYMPQRFSLYPDLTVAENLRFFADIFNVKRKEREERTERLMHFSKLAPFMDRRASQLSGGMKQKLALSCTLIHTPRVLFLDEPTTGVDPVSRREFWSLLGDLNRQGVTMLVTTPYMDEAARCHRVAFIHKGQVLATDTPEGLPSRFKHALLRVYGPDLYQRAGEMARMDGIIAVQRFGDRLHLTVDDPAAVGLRLRREFGERYEIGPIRPTLEDTFIALMQEAA